MLPPFLSCGNYPSIASFGTGLLPRTSIFPLGSTIFGMIQSFPTATEWFEHLFFRQLLPIPNLMVEIVSFEGINIRWYASNLGLDTLMWGTSGGWWQRLFTLHRYSPRDRSGSILTFLVQSLPYCNISGFQIHPWFCWLLKSLHWFWNSALRGHRAFPHLGFEIIEFLLFLRELCGFQQ